MIKVLNDRLERISSDKHYLDSLIFKLNNSPSGSRIGLELSSESPKISPEIFGQTLRLFVKGLAQRKGIDKNIWVKNFIKKIDYSKEEIFIMLYYKRNSAEFEVGLFGNGRAAATAAEKAGSQDGKKITPIPMYRGNDTYMAVSFRQNPNLFQRRCFCNKILTSSILPNRAYQSKKIPFRHRAEG